MPRRRAELLPQYAGRIKPRLTLGVIAVWLGLAIALLAFAAAAPLSYSRAVRSIQVFAKKGCTADHECGPWRLSKCERRSPFTVSCQFVGQVRSSPCRNTISARLVRHGAFERLSVTAEKVKACPLGEWAFEAQPSGPPTD
jgi:hypothetical protein